MGVNQIEFQPLKIEGAYLIKNFEYEDQRGGFVKCFSEESYRAENINFQVKEVYYSISHANVIRGMHFQKPPHNHAKLICVAKGSIIDVVLDIRKESRTFGEFMAVELMENVNSIYIPSGCAHGFESLQDHTIVIYNQSSCYSPDSDDGILWNSFGYGWKTVDPVLSLRDKSFQRFSEFRSPF